MADTKEKKVARLKLDAAAKIREAERAAFVWWCACTADNPEHAQAGKILENVRAARTEIGSNHG